MINYDWKRFWYPRGTELNYYDNNYLPDPEDKDRMAKYYNPEIKTFDEINHLNCLVLLGEPGIGKTEFLKNEKEEIKKDIQNSNSLLIWLNLDEITSSLELDKYIFETTEFLKWKNGKENLYIFLDSFDECKTPPEILSNKIINKIGEVEGHKSRLYLRIACRSSEWPIKLERFLASTWTQISFGIYLMAPLRRKDIIVAAQLNEIEPEKFLEEINKRNITTFARIPLLLDSLITLYKTDGSLPSSKKELLEKSSKILCLTKNNPQKHSSDLQMMIVGRIACFSLFSNVNTIYLENDNLSKPSNSLWIEDLLGYDEYIDGKRLNVDNIGIIKNALNTSFFTRTGPTTVKWVHLSHQAFLAAWYIHNKKLPINNILNIVSNIIDGIHKIIPRFKESLSWLCSYSVEYFENILKIDPIILAKGDTSILDTNQKEAIVKSIFHSYEEGKIHSQELFFLSDLEQLNFPGLESVIKPYIEDKNTEINLRAFALDLVNECKLKTLEADMVKIVFDKTEFPRMRTIAVEAIGNFGIDENKKQFTSLLNLQEKEDPYDEIRGHCLEILYPDYIDASTLFKNLEERNNHHHFGSFWRFLSFTLPERLKDEHLIDALAWVRRQPLSDRIDRVFQDLILIIITRSFRLIEDSNIYNALILTLMDRIKKFDPIFEKINKYDNSLNLSIDMKEKIFLYLLEETDDINLLYTTLMFHSTLLKDIDIKIVVDNGLTP